MPEFNVQTKRKRINVFKIGDFYMIKHFFDNKESFKNMVDYYNPETYQFVMKNEEAKNKVIEYLQMKAGFDIQIIEDPSNFMVKIGKDKKYGAILRNSIDYRESKDTRIFVMKDMAAVEEAVSLGAEKYLG
ncbi:MAG: hypothetical protein IBX40_10060 [Methanosarcinales archaeon]|nr:hypothetical protein [Methanosarcinales archaeon]